MKEEFCIDRENRKKWGMILIIAASCCLVLICVIGILRRRKRLKSKNTFVYQSDVAPKESDGMQIGNSQSPEWERGYESDISN